MKQIYFWTEKIVIKRMRLYINKRKTGSATTKFKKICSYKFTVLYYTMHTEKMASFMIGVNDCTTSAHC
jgi:hypothetical protein